MEASKQEEFRKQGENVFRMREILADPIFGQAIAICVAGFDITVPESADALTSVRRLSAAAARKEMVADLIQLASPWDEAKPIEERATFGVPLQDMPDDTQL